VQGWDIFQHAILFTGRKNCGANGAIDSPLPHSAIN